MKVLIIEDAPEIVEAVSIIIEMRWHESKIISTSMGEQGIDLAGSISPNVIILDLGLPDISGFDVPAADKVRMVPPQHKSFQNRVERMTPFS